MKATSIEQIREHLAKGGRVVSYRGDTVLQVDPDGKIRYESPADFTWRAKFNAGDWQLLPLEEKEQTLQEYKEAAAGRLVKFIREHSSGQCRVMSIGEACECPLCDVGRLLEEKEPVDHGTQKGQASIIPGEGYVQEARTRQRIRTRLLHGQWPEMQDLLDWWEATTGERIEWGRRCKRCDGSGRVFSGSVAMTNPMQPIMEQCGCDRGYSVRPTWMEEGK